MKKILILIIIIIGLSVPLIKTGACFGAVGPENPTGNSCNFERVSIIGWFLRNI